MSFNSLKENIENMKKIVREIYIFNKYLNYIGEIERRQGKRIEKNEKMLLINSINSLIIQLNILNNSIPSLIDNIKIFQELPKIKNEDSKKISKEKNKLIKIKHKHSDNNSILTVTINEKDREKFLKNLNRSNLSINKLKEKYSVEEHIDGGSKKPNYYAKISNRYFRNLSEKYSKKPFFKNLNKDLRKMNSPFVLRTYISMIFFSVMISFIFSVVLFVVLLFYNISLTFPFFSRVDSPLLIRFLEVFWIIPVIPLLIGLIVYSYPLSEAKKIGSRINQELPFVVIYMSAISTSGVTPVNLFKIILKNKEYPYTNTEFKKLMNLVNFQGYDLVSALRKIAITSPSVKLRELLNGLITTITTGGDLHMFLDKHAESLLFDYKLEREKYTRISEVFMDIYISVVIAAPMILLILFVIMGSTGMNFLGISPNIMGILIIFTISFLNIGFLIFLKFKQPTL